MRALIIEDDPQIAVSVTRALEGAGFAVDAVDDGEEGWFRAETDTFDLIVLDLGLPRLDGLTLLRRIRAADVGTPVLILTARDAWMERVDGIDAGADDYVSKPFYAQELVARADAILRRLSGHRTPLLKAGDMVVDTRRMRVTIDGKAVPLSPLEFRLLRYLVHNVDRVVSKAEIAEHVYASEQDPDSNALEVMIGRLRRKLGEDRLKTKRGFGYVVEG